MSLKNLSSANSDFSSVAERDRHLFDEIAKTYLRKDTVRSSRVARIQRLKETIRSVPLTSDTLLLEIGCGAGFAPLYLENTYKSYLGIDHSKALIQLAKAQFEDTSKETRFLCGDACDLDEVEVYDGIVIIGVLHHMEKPKESLETFFRLLKPGGWIAVNEPNGANPLIQLLRRLRKSLDKTYSDEQFTYRSDVLHQQFVEAGFVDLKVRGQGLLSTPFAEVPIGSSGLFVSFSKVACAVDRFFEKRIFSNALRAISWNLVASGRKPVSEETK